MRILLTGAAGFIGSAVADELVGRGHQVVPLDLLLPSAHDLRAPAPATIAGAPLHRVDVRDEGEVTRLLAGVDAVCHKAAMVGLGVDFHDSPDFVAHNVSGTAALLSAMTRAGVQRLVQASSMVVYGPGRWRCAEHGERRPGPRSRAALAEGRFDPPCPDCDRPLTWRTVREDDPTDPRNTYAATKLAQEHLATAWTEQVGGVAVSLRHHNVYGPGMPRDTPYAGVASIFRSALARGQAPTVYEDGRQLRDFVHVRDVARATADSLEWSGERGAAPEHRTWNVSSGTPRSVLDLARALADATGGPEPDVVGGGRPGDVRHVVADPARITADLGFTARIPFAEGIAEFAEAPMRA